jgi:hypothetical protein
MPAEPSSSPQQRPSEEMLTAAEVARILKVSESYAKASMRGEGPPFVRLGRSVRYVRLRQWLEDQ